MNMKKIVLLVLALSVVLMASSSVYALCDIGNGRVVHAESAPFNNATTQATIYWIAPSGGAAPTVYYVFTTSNASFREHLNAAHAGNLQVRVTGNAAACPAAGALRAGGTIVAVFRDSFN